MQKGLKSTMHILPPTFFIPIRGISVICIKMCVHETGCPIFFKLNPIIEQSFDISNKILFGAKRDDCLSPVVHKAPGRFG